MVFVMYVAVKTGRPLYLVCMISWKCQNQEVEANITIGGPEYVLCEFGGSHSGPVLWEVNAM
jgi:hypothetical protein